MYKREAAHVRELIAEYDPDYEAGGLDELFFDLTDYVVQRAGATSMLCWLGCFVDLHLQRNGHEYVGVAVSAGCRACQLANRQMNNKRCRATDAKARGSGMRTKSSLLAI